MVFRSAVDAWFYGLVAATAVVTLAALLPLLKSGRPGLVVLALVLALVTIGLPVWLLLSTVYVVGDHALIVTSGPFRWYIPRAEITSVRRSRSLLSSPALSIDRLEIAYGRHGRILVSPKDRDGFLRALGHTLADR